MSFRQGQPWEALWLLRLQRPVSWKSQKLFRSKKPILKLICLFQEAGLLLWFQDAREQIYCKISCQEMPLFSRYVRNDGTQNGPEKVSHARALIFALLACFADFCRSFGVESSSWLLQLLVSMGFTKYSTETFRVLPVQGGWCHRVAMVTFNAWLPSMHQALSSLRYLIASLSLFCDDQWLTSVVPLPAWWESFPGHWNVHLLFPSAWLHALSKLLLLIQAMGEKYKQLNLI